MSGGHWNYQDSNLLYDVFGWGCSDKNIPNIMEDREVSEMLYDILSLMHDYDWYISGDTSKESYLKAKKKFKDKWLEIDSKARVKRQIDTSIEEARNELYDTFGVSIAKGIEEDVDKN